MTQPKISTKYRVSGPNVMSFQQQEGSIVDRVPTGYYKVEEHPFLGYYLVRISDNVTIPEHIFGSTLPRCQRIFEAYGESHGSLGVGLFGKKGAGKSLLASVIAHTGIQKGIPVIDVSDSFTTDPAYLEFLNSIDECVIVFDEFLKHLSKLEPKLSDNEGDHHQRRNQRQLTANDRQDEMLTFFQGTHNRKRLIVLIDNQSYMLSDFLTDRPGRMRYMYNYDGVEREVVEALAEHYKFNPEKASAVVTYALRYKVSFDVINEVIKEWSRYPNETLEDITSILNVPTLRPSVETKMQVVSFSTDPENGDSAKATLESELALMDDEGRIRVKVQTPNPLYMAPELTREAYSDSEHDYMDYDDYVKLRTQPLRSHSWVYRVGDLVSIKGNRAMYENNGITVVLETLGTTVVNPSEAWANAL